MSMSTFEVGDIVEHVEHINCSYPNCVGSVGVVESVNKTGASARIAWIVKTAEPCPDGYMTTPAIEVRRHVK